MLTSLLHIKIYSCLYARQTEGANLFLSGRIPGESEKAEEFLLSDLDDRSVYRSAQGYKDNVVNPALDSTFRFIETVLAALVSFHKDIQASAIDVNVARFGTCGSLLSTVHDELFLADRTKLFIPKQPLKTFHFGGDEVPRNVWTASPSCDFFRAQFPRTDTFRSDMMKHFLVRTSQIAAKYGELHFSTSNDNPDDEVLSEFLVRGRDSDCRKHTQAVGYTHTPPPPSPPPHTFVRRNSNTRGRLQRENGNFVCIGACVWEGNPWPVVRVFTVKVKENSIVSGPELIPFQRSQGSASNALISYCSVFSGVNIQGWEDAFYVGQKLPQRREVFPTNIELKANCWKNVWEYGSAHHLYELANAGYKVRFIPASRTL